MELKQGWEGPELHAKVMQVLKGFHQKKEIIRLITQKKSLGHAVGIKLEAKRFEASLQSL